MSSMGLDIGTTGCKALVFDEGGRTLASSYREYPMIHARPGWAELDSVAVCEACLTVIREAAARAPGDPVTGLGISSQGEAFTAVDGQGRPLCHAMVSSDARAAEISRRWSGQFGRERLYRITGHTAHPMFSLFKLLWLRENCPDVWSGAARFLCFEDLMQMRLGLDPAIGWPLAGRTMLFDIRRHEWSGEILNAIGLDPARLARPLASGSVAGSLSPAMARELGLAEGAIVVAGGHDQPCGALGAGAIEEGVAMIGTGTVECITPAFAAPVQSEALFRANLCTYDHAARGMFTTVAFCLTGGNLLKWFRDEFGRQEIAEAARDGADPYDLLLKRMAPEPTDLMALPYFTPSGTPYFDAQTRGAILGLRLTTSRGELLRGLLEGVTLEMRLNLEILNDSGVAIRELRAIGGGARSAAWMQLKADIFNRPLARLTVTEAGCLGVAMLAHAAQSGTALKTLAQEWIAAETHFEPNQTRTARYEEKFVKYKKLYPALRDLEQTLSEEDH
jgi:xylulokinase